MTVYNSRSHVKEKQNVDWRRNYYHPTERKKSRHTTHKPLHHQYCTEDKRLFLHLLTKHFHNICAMDNDENEQVLLVGRMGLKSVQVRAGTGMKIVNGTLQRQPSVKPSRGGGGGGDASTASGAHSGPGAGVASARGVEGGASTPEFARVRPALFGAAWRSMVEASGFAVDDSGDVASAFVLVGLW